MNKPKLSARNKTTNVEKPTKYITKVPPIRETSGESKETGGRETHQRPKSADAFLSTNQGLPISDNQNSLKAGKRGPALLEDFILREKITHFDPERIPGRIVSCLLFSCLQRLYLCSFEAIRDYSCSG